MRAIMRGGVGFVPTMGVLHAGHLALLGAAKSAVLEHDRLHAVLGCRNCRRLSNGQGCQPS